jgi:hypothetical protein
MAVRRADSAFANLETIRATNVRFEQRFIEESPIIAIEPQGKNQIRQRCPTLLVEVQAELRRIVAQGKTDRADEFLAIKNLTHGNSFRKASSV